jgi:hypothetical protein
LITGLADEHAGVLSSNVQSYGRAMLSYVAERLKKLRYFDISILVNFAHSLEHVCSCCNDATLVIRGSLLECRQTVFGNLHEDEIELWAEVIPLWELWRQEDVVIEEIQGLSTVDGVCRHLVWQLRIQQRSQWMLVSGW